MPSDNTCAVCGKAFNAARLGRRAKYCSDKCSKIAGCRGLVCKHCGKTFNGTYLLQKHCSSACRRVSRGLPASRRCRTCGDEVKGRPLVATICTRCSKSKNYLGPAPKRITCRYCGKVFISTGARAQDCSRACRHQWRKLHNMKAIRANRRQSNHRRRVRQHFGVYEVFDSYEIFERDGWECQMCGIETLREWDASDAALRAKSPTLDHIIPLSKGGNHTRENTQLLCWHCNCIVKGDAIEPCQSTA